MRSHLGGHRTWLGRSVVDCWQRTPSGSQNGSFDSKVETATQENHQLHRKQDFIGNNRHRQGGHVAHRRRTNHQRDDDLDESTIRPTTQSEKRMIKWSRVQQTKNWHISMVPDGGYSLPGGNYEQGRNNKIRLRLRHHPCRQLRIEVHHQLDQRLRQASTESDRSSEGNGKRQNRGHGCRYDSMDFR